MIPQHLADLLSSAGAGIVQWGAAIWAAPGIRRLAPEPQPEMVQEEAGFHLSITPEIKVAARHAARCLVDQYAHWLERGAGPTPFTRRHFTVAVGGGNTVKNLYHALLAYHFRDLDWVGHVRFFVIEETWGGSRRESPRESLLAELIGPLSRKLIIARGANAMRDSLGLAADTSYEDIADRLGEVMLLPINPGAMTARLAQGDHAAALEEARTAARRYQRLLREALGPAMAFHMIVSGVGKDGGIGAFEPYSPLLKNEAPGVRALVRTEGAVSVVVNRGVLTGAHCVALLIAGSHKLRALGRFEMDDSADFEQTVRETPVRMLRKTRDIAEKVYIFADDRALMFEEEVFRFRAGRQTIEVKSEVRAGDEIGGIHILLVHGFMGLYSYINLLIRLPRAWQVSALRRSRHAKSLPPGEVFPHHARVVRKMVLSNWREGRPTPICCHSMAGLISDHLLLSVLSNYDGELPAFDQLRPEDRQLVEALRVGGIINIATWAPSDTDHFLRNLKDWRKGASDAEAPGPGAVYQANTDGALRLSDEQQARLHSMPRIVGKLIDMSGTELLVNSLNKAVRHIVGRVNLQKAMKPHAVPYGMRLLSNRVLQKVSFYGVLKEADAAMHDPREYHERHLKALEAIVRYDIPYLCIVHRHDFMVSALRHTQEHEYLLAARLKKEGVHSERALNVPVRLVRLGDDAAPTKELIDPHFLILSTTREGVDHAREVTAAMTSFVQENVARAIAEQRVRPLASVPPLRLGRRQPAPPVRPRGPVKAAAD